MSRRDRITGPFEVFGHRFNPDHAPIRQYVDTRRVGDYGADPLGDGTFRMVPSGDIVDFAERNRRLPAGAR